MFALGVITGILLCIFTVLALKKYETPIERTIKQTQSKLKPKGTIIEPESAELEDWINTLPSA